MAAIELKHITRRFPGSVTAVEDCTLHAADGEYLVILGPSGCGKTTLLRLIAGLDRPDAGTIAIGGRDFAGARPHERGIGMISQDSALYPHMTVARNLAFPLRTRRVDRAEIDRRIESLSQLLRITPLLRRKPGELSGGERQRAALGRALIIQPRALLLDEPLSHLDAHLRDELRRELKRIHQQLQPTVIHVTHDQDEAVELGERIALMAEGRMQQIGTPEEVSRRPANRFVAGFLGRPPINFLTGVLRESGEAGGEVVLERQVRGNALCQLTLPIERDGLPAGAMSHAMKRAMNRQVTLGIRPDAIRLVHGETDPHLLMTVSGVHRKLDMTHVVGRLPGGDRLLMRWPAGAQLPESDQAIAVAWSGSDMLLFEPGPIGEAIR